MWETTLDKRKLAELNREKEDAEYERQRAVDAADKARRDAKRARMQALAEIESVQVDLVDANEELCQVIEEVRLLREFLRETGLSAEFEEWVVRRSEA